MEEFLINSPLSLGIAQRWKTKFKTAYNHEVIEDEESQKRG